MKKDIVYEKLSDNALKCMYVATAIASIIGLIIIGVLNYIWFFPSDIQVCKILSLIISIIILLNAIISPYFRHSRYRYCINDECIDVKEGYLFINRDIVPIERLVLYKYSSLLNHSNSYAYFSYNKVVMV